MIREQDLQRLPIDVLAGGADRDRRPDPSAFPLSVAEYGRQHAKAVAGSLFSDRARALRGLIAHGDEAIKTRRAGKIGGRTRFQAQNGDASTRLADLEVSMLSGRPRSVRIVSATGYSELRRQHHRPALPAERQCLVAELAKSGGREVAVKSKRFPDS